MSKPQVRRSTDPVSANDVEKILQPGSVPKIPPTFTLEDKVLGTGRQPGKRHSRLTSQQRRELIQKHTPVMYLSREERYGPNSVEEYTSQCSLHRYGKQKQRPGASCMQESTTTLEGGDQLLATGICFQFATGHHLALCVYTYAQTIMCLFEF
jgi:hypothetical protein